jgi:SWI/SNF related-matrix-associated actin-dependent regulator of chromatin subfamily C
VWNDQETLLMLEALELFGADNWLQVADHVGTKLPHQCVLHFLQLPIEDPYLEQMELEGEGASLPGVDVARGGASEVGRGGEVEVPKPGAPLSFPLANRVNGLKEGALPFVDAGNPMMAQVAFLAAMVSPRVAAAAAQAALHALMEDHPAHETQHLLKQQQIGNLETKTGNIQTNTGNVEQQQAQAEVRKRPRPEEADGGEDDALDRAAKLQGTDGATEADQPMGADTSAAGSSPAAATAATAAAAAAAAAAVAAAAAAATAGPSAMAPSLLRTQQAAATALGSAAVKAKLMADQEEREIQRLTTHVVELQVTRGGLEGV